MFCSPWFYSPHLHRLTYYTTTTTAFHAWIGTIHLITLMLILLIPHYTCHTNRISHHYRCVTILALTITTTSAIATDTFAYFTVTVTINQVTYNAILPCLISYFTWCKFMIRLSVINPLTPWYIKSISHYSFTVIITNHSNTLITEYNILVSVYLLVDITQ